MIKKIFIYIFSAVLVAVILESILISLILFSSLNTKTEKFLDVDLFAVSRILNTKLNNVKTQQTLKTENNNIEKNIENENIVKDGIIYLSLIDNSRSDRRFTWIASDGTVLYDTIKTSLENHIDRPEFQEALKNGIGKASRFSETLAEKTLYTALRLDNNSVLRLAQTQQSVFSFLITGLKPFLIGLFVLILLSIFFAILMAKKITKPINELNLDNPELNKISCYEELEPLLFRLIKQKAEIHDTMEKLQYRQKEFENITSCMNEGIILLNNKLNILSLNNKVQKIFSVKNEDCIGHYVLTLDRSESYITLIQSIVDEKLPYECEFTKNERWYKITANHVYTGNKKTGTVLFITDITTSRNAEQTRRDFTANVSHELKTPLTSISGYAEIIRDGISEPKDICDFASRIYSESKRLLNLIEDIIKLSFLDEMTLQTETKFQNNSLSITNENLSNNKTYKLTSLNKNENAFVPINLSELVTKISLRLELEASKKNVKFELSLPSTPCVIYGNEIILDELVYNLCDNAIKYNKEGGKVKVSVTSKEREESNKMPNDSEPSEKVLSSSNYQTGITLIVSDTGIGIPENEKEKVFERFYRVDKSRSKQTGGTGLGLAIVKHAAQYHNAKIELDSTLGKGTTVTVKF